MILVVMRPVYIEIYSAEEYTITDSWQMAKSELESHSIVENELIEPSEFQETDEDNFNATPVRISACGDLLMMKRALDQGISKGFRSLWKKTVPYFKASDISFLQFEGVASDRLVSWPPNFNMVHTTSTPKGFNYPTKVLDDLSKFVDVFSTANNHAFDRGFPGVASTIATIKKTGSLHTGTRVIKANVTGNYMDWYTVVTRNDRRIAFIACTGFVNNNPIVGYRVKTNDSRIRRSILHCDSAVHVVETIAARGDIDAIIAAPHMGTEFSSVPAEKQIEIAKALLDAGAVVTIGNHVHMVQPMEKYKTKDGRLTAIIYALGNFAGGMIGTDPVLTKSSALAFIDLAWNNKNVAHVTNVKYLPLCEARDNFIMEVLPAIQSTTCRREYAHVLKIIGQTGFVEPILPEEVLSYQPN